MGKPECGICGAAKVHIQTATVKSSVWVCPNCDQYPWIIQPLTDREVLDQDRKASQIARGEQ